MITDFAVMSLTPERHPVLLKTFITEDPYWKNGTLNSHPQICGLLRETKISDKNSCIKFGESSLFITFWFCKMMGGSNLASISLNFLNMELKRSGSR